MTDADATDATDADADATDADVPVEDAFCPSSFISNGDDEDDVDDDVEEGLLMDITSPNCAADDDDGDAVEVFR